MKRNACIGVVLLGAVAVGALVVLGFIAGPVEEGDGERFSVETTTLGRLIDTPCTLDVFVTRFGAGPMLESSAAGLARHLTLRRLVSFPLADLDDQKLKVIQVELVKLDPRAPECRRKKGREPGVDEHTAPPAEDPEER